MTPLDRIANYLASDYRWRPTLEPIAVAISRQTGSGAIAIAELLAEYLQSHADASGGPWAIFDKNLMAKVLEEHDLPARLAQFLPEDRIPVARDWLEEALGLHPEYRVIVQQSAETILKLALLGNVILVGRGANIITGNLPHVVRVRLIAPLEKRIERVQQRYHIAPKEAGILIHRGDHGRARYVKKYFRQSVSDGLLYDLTLNTDRISDAEAARLVGEVVLGRKQALYASLVPS